MKGIHDITCHFGVSNLSNFMKQADFMITAASSTVWQACCSGLPMIAIKTIENQNEVINTLLHKGSALTCDAITLKSAPDRNSEFIGLLENIMEMNTRKKLSNRSMSIVDGYGAKRVVEHMVQKQGL